ncbi:MAG: aspartate aminotransferase family protein [Saprospiraceae bacterium]|nr:aspartate aminotransferase family protein [Saprospiraceae bacterium]MBP9208773.1 aspartate aminotransferase family protein [Saprospiraceae bacterium]
MRQQFLNYIAQTSEVPQGFCMGRAKGNYLFDREGKAYLDLSSGFGVSNLGHGVPEVLDAIASQSREYLHTNVYGEHVQKVQIRLAERLADLLPAGLDAFYYLTSGSEAVDAAIKLSRLATGRTEIAVCRNAYHGSTLGAESLRSDEEHKAPFLPLLPGVRFIQFGESDDLAQIGPQTAAVFTEVIQAEAGVRFADPDWWKALRARCDQTGSLLVLDEIQTGMGRTGKLFAFMHGEAVPDILLAGKALGAGMPLSALITSQTLFRQLFRTLPLAHLSTFGGHPVSCAAGLAGLNVLLRDGLMENARKMGKRLAEGLLNPMIRDRRHAGLFMAAELGDAAITLRWIAALYKENMLAESFLFDPGSLRIAPPLSIRESEVDQVVALLNRL